MHLISASERQKGLWGLRWISFARECTPVFVSVERNVCNQYLSPWKSKERALISQSCLHASAKNVTSKFSEPWKISCNQELGLKRNCRKSCDNIDLSFRNLVQDCFQGEDLLQWLWFQKQIGPMAGQGSGSQGSETIQELLGGPAALFPT